MIMNMIKITIMNMIMNRIVIMNIMMMMFWSIMMMMMGRFTVESGPGGGTVRIEAKDEIKKGEEITVTSSLSLPL